MSFKYIDLFAGCGGLSLGLKQAGGELLVAVEKSPMAAETYYHNFIQPLKSSDQWAAYCNSTSEEQVKNGLLVKPVSELISQLSDKSYASLPTSADLVVGGPPCQGFSLAGRRNPEDSRNNLPWEFLKVVELTQPKAVVIENVVGMRHKFSEKDEHSVFDQLQIALAQTCPGYTVQAVSVNALHFGAPQNRPRLLIIGLRNDIATAKDIKSTNTLWESNFADLMTSEIPPLAPKPTAKSSAIPTVGMALNGLDGAKASNSYSKAMASKWQGIKQHNGVSNHVFRKHSARIIKRFALYQWFEKYGIESKVLAIAEENFDSAREAILEKVRQTPMPAISLQNEVLAETHEELVELIFDLRTMKHSQSVLKADKPSKTVLTVGDDYVHPFEARTFTVRELARFQGFPDSFEFRAKETTGGIKRKDEVPQYSQVGNAVSPWLAISIGRLIDTLIS